MSRRFLYPFGLLAGGVIGVGIFGLPASAARAGMLPFLLEGALVIAIVWTIQMFFAEVVLGTKGRHRIPGYAEQYLGRWGKVATVFSNIFGIYGALLAYLIAGGTFLRLILAPSFDVSSVQATIVYLAIGAFLVYRGVGKVAVVELFLLVLFLLTLIGLGIESRDTFSLENIRGLGVGETFLPYGVLLFAFWGMSLIPDVVEQTKRKWGVTRNVIMASNATAAVAYLLFVLIVVGVTGNATTAEAFEGLATVLGPGAVTLGLIFGLLTTFSSFLAFALVLQETFMFDFRLPKQTSWVLTMFVPFCIYLVGVRELVSVLSITGAVFMGAEGAILVFIVQSFFAKKGIANVWRSLLLAGLVFALVFGVVFSIVNVAVA